MQGLLNLFDLYGERFLVVGVSLLSLTFVTLMFLWSYNRRRFMAYKHHIPARVMQGYLDSVIQNSSALKSSLLRGGGSDSVALPMNFSTEGLFHPEASQGGENNNTTDDAQKNAELASLKSQISEKDSMISDLEEKMTDLLSKLRDVEDNRNQAVEVATPVTGGASEATLLQLSEITKERDLLKDKLKEYEFIESDLAEIPRLQRTVETYKATLKQLGVDPEEALKTPAASPATDTAAPQVATVSTPASPATENQPAANVAATTPAVEPGAVKDEKKGDDDLLQQFEKMLG